MKSTFFIILIILGNICFSCAKQKVEGLDTRFRAIDDYLGRYVEIKFMNDELRNKYIYKYIRYKNKSILVEEIQEKLSEFEIMDIEENSDIPFLWLNSSTWELFAKKSMAVAHARRNILNGQRKNMYCFVRKDKTMNERIIISKQSNNGIIVLIETLKIK